MWVWDKPQPADLLTWVRDQEVAEIFLRVGPDFSATGDLQWVRSVVALMTRHGVRVAAAGGATEWVDDPSPALAWQRAVVGTGLFERIHFDIEVWARDDWVGDQLELGAAYLSLLRSLRAACPLRLEADIAFHLHEVPTVTGDSLQAAVMRVVDAVTVLSYRNTVTGPDSITAVAASAAEEARRLSVPCRLAAETKYLGADPVSRKQTFHGMGPSALERALDQVDDLMVPNAMYAGMAVHDHERWRAL